VRELALGFSTMWSKLNFPVQRTQGWDLNRAGRKRLELAWSPGSLGLHLSEARKKEQGKWQLVLLKGVVSLPLSLYLPASAGCSRVSSVPQWEKPPPAV